MLIYLHVQKIGRRSDGEHVIQVVSIIYKNIDFYVKL